ncbi:L-histidine N(alpha)-methyltransferase [Rhodopila globiformis]|uniref:L-histidine N(Alpha)-methyltransferase n=1 Tax=Rhodopila globiformis TaxID=1071 RepID=A0A2S6MY44_RHOGL|nr:L-histidine N(alpha)-methyltransferase [Rhodopila globiformis]PPQ27276.1 L-histidine N(alpha)-methyltransferase [Rhodopila globiformis]
MPNDPGFAPHALCAETAEAALSGLTASPKTLPAKLFYDPEGCRLFYRITELPEYYLTRTETGLLRTLGRSLIPEGFHSATLVEFGGSDEAKARYLLDQRDDHRRRLFATYVPIDVAASALEDMRFRLANSHPDLAVEPIVADFVGKLALPPLGRQRMGLFPGSTIGNLDPDVAVRFLASAREALGPGSWFLLGADLRKDPAILLPAYNDSAGVTAAFNLNLLCRLNREAAADFDLRHFRHAAVWNDALSRIEMHLIASRDQVVHVAGSVIPFAEGESIHTENSYKWTRRALVAMVAAAGWEPHRIWTDSEDLFGIFLLRHA